MVDAVLENTSKVKRIYPALAAVFQDKKCISLIGVDGGAIKAIAITEKLKQNFFEVAQQTQIMEYNNKPSIQINLVLP